MIAVRHLDEEGVRDRDRVDLDVNVHFDESAVLLVGVGDQVNAGNVAERSFVIRINLVDLKTILEEFSIHHLLNLNGIN